MTIEKLLHAVSIFNRLELFLANSSVVDYLSFDLHNLESFEGSDFHSDLYQ